MMRQMMIHNDEDGKDRNDHHADNLVHLLPLALDLFVNDKDCDGDNEDGEDDDDDNNDDV